MGFMVDKVALGQFFSPRTKALSASVIPPMYQIHSFILLRLYLHLAVDMRGQLTHNAVSCVPSVSAWLRRLLFVCIFILMDTM
jgi:hypothetical protein